MKKRKIEILERKIYDDNLIKVDIEESGEYYFEIKNEITNDIAEAVSIMMKIRNKWDDDVWMIPIPDLDTYNVNPERCLYWLSGGHDEWRKLDNYKRSWKDSYLEFREEFGSIVIDILKKSRNLKDIRDGFLKYLNIERIYEFALERNLA